jgi:hypothetical protein
MKLSMKFGFLLNKYMSTFVQQGNGINIDIVESAK